MNDHAPNRFDGMRRAFFYLALIVLPIVAVGLAAWWLATITRSFPMVILQLLFALPTYFASTVLLQRRCYPNTPLRQVLQATSVSPLDRVPAPFASKALIALVASTHTAFAMLLFYVVVARTWHGAMVAPPENSLVYDLAHPWSVSPIHTINSKPDSDRFTLPHSTPTPWWIFPGISLVLIPFITFAWCGTLEKNSPHRQVPEAVNPSAKTQFDVGLGGDGQDGIWIRDERQG